MKLSVLPIAAALLTACSTLETVPNPGEATDGLIYYMPNKDFVATITVKSGQNTNVAFSESAAYPDLSARFALQFSRNPIAKNTLDVGVSEKGLLTSTKSDAVPGISDALKSLAGIAGTVSGFAPFLAPVPVGCPDGDYVLVFAPAVTPADTCGVHIEVSKIVTRTLAVTAKEVGASDRSSGIYYRQSEPYRVTGTISVSGQNITKEAILFSPSASAIRFLPISKTFFASNHAELTFTDGMPTKYKQDADGELVAALKLPADVISAYFAAIGAVFDSFKEKDTKEAAALDASTKLELARAKYAACLAAIQGKADAAVIAKLGC
jgi:hypothetical protein